MTSNELLQKESEKFRETYLWLENAMPDQFFEQIGQENAMLIVHNLMEFDRRDFFSSILLKNSAIVLCLNQPDSDLKILKNFIANSITSYQTYISKSIPPFVNTTSLLRIVVMHFFPHPKEKSAFTSETLKAFQLYMTNNHPELNRNEIEQALNNMSESFIHSLPMERLAIAVKMFHRATTRDHCQYEVQYNEDWETEKTSSMQMVMAWRNTPKHNFLYRLLRVINRHGLEPTWISSSFLNPYQPNSIFLLALDIDSIKGKAVWEVANILKFVKELITVKYFASFDNIDRLLVQKGIIAGDMGNLLRAMENFIHQSLVHIDPNIYTLEHVEEALCRHPELTAQLCKAFQYRFDPDYDNEKKYQDTRDQLLSNIAKLDTGHEENDVRRKNVLSTGMNFIHNTLKTNFYRPNYTSLSFRLDPKYLEELPFDRTKKFPELPYGIIFIKGMHFFGFHIRFKDLARGGLRTVFPEHMERMVLERNSAFTECYNLALTQHMKNKDIPEGGAKAIIFLKPYERVESEAAIYRKELSSAIHNPEELDKQIELFRQEQRTEHLYKAQRSFIESLVTIVNSDEYGKLRVKDIIDYWGKPEYIYLGPDENMHDVMIEWIAKYSKKHKYKPGSSFISGKPNVGINHKEFGVTSLGVNVYMESVLRYLGINPLTDTFTVKMSGGPDGDVAGNQICNLYRFYPNTAKLIALTDISGTIYDPKGLDLKTLTDLFKETKSIRFYPPSQLNEGGFLADKTMKRTETPLVQQTLCWRLKNGKLEQDWLTGSELNYLLRHNVHQTYADIFIPGGGRPRTLNESNYKDYLDGTGKPTSKAIIEGANLYLSPGARKALEALGVLIIKDSSANKTGVICSSFEVLSGLTLGDERFIIHKKELVKEILSRLYLCAANEASLLLRTHKDTGEPLTEISDKISKRINMFTDQLLDYLEDKSLTKNPNDPFIISFLNYCLPLLRENFQENLLTEIPESHKKAIIACHLAAHLVYEKGLSWFPSIVDILPMLLK